MDAGNVPVFTKESLIEKLKDIAAIGWIKNARSGNDGGIGNILEDLLGIEENNLPIPNAAEWELKTQRLGSNALVTLCHSEPSFRAPFGSYHQFFFPFTAGHIKMRVKDIPQPKRA